MKKHVLGSLLCGITVALASAPAFADFSGTYDVTNWTISGTGGLVDLSGAPAAVTMVSSDSGSGTDEFMDFTITAPTAVVVSLRWDYTSVDIDGDPVNDQFGRLLNGSFTQLSPDVGGPMTASGTDTFAVPAGTAFGFRTFSVDSILGPATTVISDFTVTAAPIPEPESYAMLLAGLGLIGFMARRRLNTAR